jgi:hypothetical protein
LTINSDAKEFVVAPDGRFAAVSDQHAPGKLTVIDLAARAVLAASDEAGAEWSDVQFASDGQRLMLAAATSERIGMVDLRGYGAVRTPAAPQLSAASGVSRPTRHTYLSLASGVGTAVDIIAVDPESATVVHRFRLPGGGAAAGAALEPR